VTYAVAASPYCGICLSLQPRLPSELYEYLQEIMPHLEEEEFDLEQSMRSAVYVNSANKKFGPENNCNKPIMKREFYTDFDIFIATNPLIEC
jgi:hypothetical protein